MKKLGTLYIKEILLNNPILITNDDGFGKDGLKCVIDAVQGLAPILVIVPSKNQSGLSHRITIHETIHVREHRSRIPGVTTYVIDGTPADCVRLGVYVLSKRPIRMVIAGINHGANMGEDVVYSGTVAAAREGAMQGIPSMAVSYAAKKFRNSAGISEAVRTCAQWLLNNHVSKHLYINVNIPPRISPAKKIFELTRLGRRIYGTKYVKTLTMKNKWTLVLKESISGIAARTTDINAVRKGRISVTPLTLDFVDTVHLKKLKKITNAPWSR